MKGWRRYERLRTEQRGTGPRNHENRTNRTATDRATEPRERNGTEPLSFLRFWRGCSLSPFLFLSFVLCSCVSVSLAFFLSVFLSFVLSLSLSLSFFLSLAFSLSFFLSFFLCLFFFCFFVLPSRGGHHDELAKNYTTV